MSPRTANRGWALALLAFLPLGSQAADQCKLEAKIQPNNQIVTEGAPVTINAQPSQPSDATFAWKQLSGPAITLDLSRPSKPEFIAPQVSKDEQAVFEVTVFGCGSSAKDTTVINILNSTSTTNTAPTAVANAVPELPNEGALVTLSSTGSTDAQTPGQLAYQWTQVNNGAPTVTLTGANSATATFIAPQVTGAGVTLEFILRVTDPGALFHEDNALVNVQFSNDSPLASLSCPMHAAEGATVTLDGSASSDYEDDALGKTMKYTWSQTLGPPYVDVAGFTTDTISIKVPALSKDEDGGIYFELKVTDSAGAYSTTTCGLIVDDVTKPVFGGGGDRIVEATSPAGAMVNYGLSATDNVDGDLTPFIACTPASGSAFALDVPTQVDCKVKDSAGNQAETSFEVVVRDRTKPVIQKHGDVAVEATGPQGATVNYDLPAVVDLVDLHIVATCAPEPGVFAVGSHTVTCNAMDDSNNAADATTFQVTVHDLTPPEVTVPASITREATGASGATVQFVASAFDIVDEAITPTCKVGGSIVESGNTFPIGVSTVVCEATDKAGNKGTNSFTITVEDTTAPTLNLPPNIIEEATSGAGAAVAFSVTAEDIVDADVAIVCAPPSGSTFAITTTTVNCTATDDYGNEASGSFTVKVQDTTAPSIAFHADVTAIATANSEAVVTYTNPTATDIVDGLVNVTCEPVSGSMFKAGTTAVNCEATDKAGNKATSSFNVIVTYAFTGFFSPVDNLPIVNTVQAGQSIPVKFSLGGYQGMGIFAAGYPKSTVMTCGAGAQDQLEETSTAGSSTLTFDPTTGRYHYVWKTEKAWAGTCRQLQIKFIDGKVQVANFYFKK